MCCMHAHRCFQSYKADIIIKNTKKFLCPADASYLKQLIQSESNWSSPGGPEAQKPFKGYNNPFTFSMKGQLQILPAGF